MEIIQNLIDVLTSQSVLCDDLLALLKEEKKYIAKWDIDKTLEITKSKDTLLYKEKLLDEARTQIIKKIQGESEAEFNLTEIIEGLEDVEMANNLSKVQDQLRKKARVIQAENISIRLLYKTNMKMISDVFEKIGITEASGYQVQGRMAKTQGNSFVRSA